MESWDSAFYLIRGQRKQVRIYDETHRGRPNVVEWIARHQNQLGRVLPGQHSHRLRAHYFRAVHHMAARRYRGARRGLPCLGRRGAPFRECVPRPAGGCLSGRPRAPAPIGRGMECSSGRLPYRKQCSRHHRRYRQREGHLVAAPRGPVAKQTRYTGHSPELSASRAVPGAEFFAAQDEVEMPLSARSPFALSAVPGHRQAKMRPAARSGEGCWRYAATV